MILAAGASRRLGTCKALVNLATRGTAPSTPLHRLLEAGRGLNPFQRLIVTGKDHAAITRAAPTDTVIIHNADWSAGRTGGVLLARHALPGIDLCLAPVDVPLVSHVVFERLRRAWDAAEFPARGWLAPAYTAVHDGAGEARHGHPVLVGRELLARLAEKDRGLPLSHLRRAADPLWSVDVADPAILDNLDTPLQLEELRVRSNED